MRMMNPKKLCLNMIVRNEIANLERCLAAVAAHIACWVICDTGSTDGTQEFIKKFFAEHKIPGELHSTPFHNFEQARNAALDFAYASPLAYDYLLLADADMELVVEDLKFRENLEAPGYRVIQRTDSSFTYWNTRLARRDVGARYHGVTHEYLDVPGGVQELHGVWYKDHASGSNRVDKFERDINLLLDALQQEPDNSRYWFYLAQSYRDAGKAAEAAETYAKRAEMGGWDEEAWYARWQQGRCLQKLGDERGFLYQTLTAFNQRPHRAEPLYDLARFYRQRGMNNASILFSEAGLALPRPTQDVLFTEDFVYTAGLKEEFSIAAFYALDPIQKSRGFGTCDWLALSREIASGSRDLARSNLFFYLEPAGGLMPSFTARPVRFTPPDGYNCSNPSVARRGREIVMVQRTVNFRIGNNGQYETPAGTSVHTRNFLVGLNSDLETEWAKEILPPADLPVPSFTLVLGFEDLRLFHWRGEIWCIACIRELTAEGWCEQVLARIDDEDRTTCRLTNWRILRPEGMRRHEKNWIPQICGDQLRFIYLCDPTQILDEQARTIAQTIPTIAAEQFRGSTQAIAFKDGWLAIIHEVQIKVDKRCYQHRFIWFDETNKLRLVSRPFYFQTKGIEFAVGLAWHPDEKNLLISYGTSDSESWIATVNSEQVLAILEDHTRPLAHLADAPPSAGAAESRCAISQAGRKETSIFKNSTDINILSVPQSARRYLVLIRAGSQPRPSFFNDQLPADRAYDIGLNYYAPPHIDDVLSKKAEIVFAGGLAKMHGAKCFFERTELHRVYEGVLFLDEDVELLFNPDAFFAFCQEQGLSLAQPSVTADSIGVIPLTRQHPGLKFRTTNWVEIMAPFLARDFLIEMLHSFDLAISGWGIDLYWGHHLGQHRTAGILDEFLMRHTKALDDLDGPFYRYLRSIGIDPRDEMNKILKLIGTETYVARPLNFIYNSYRFGK
jgi:tetratricopeptide (TPR) repeat protein